MSPEIRPNRQPLYDLFQQLDIAWTGMDHPALHTVEESRAWRGGDLPGPHVKNLFVKDKKGNRFLVVTEENRQIDLKTLHRHIGGRGRLSFCKGEELLDVLAVPPGSATPFALMHDGEHRVKPVFDKDLFDGELINAHPLDNEGTIALSPADLQRFLAHCGHEYLVHDFDAPLPDAG